MAAVFVRHSWTHSVEVVSVSLTCEGGMDHLLSSISFSYGYCNTIFTGPHLQATHIGVTSVGSFNSHMAVREFLYHFFKGSSLFCFSFPSHPHFTHWTTLCSFCVFEIKCPELLKNISFIMFPLCVSSVFVPTCQPFLPVCTSLTTWLYPSSASGV